MAMKRPGPHKASRFTNLTNVFQRYRSMKGVSQAELAERLGIGQGTVSDYERGRRRPEVAVAQRFLALCKEKRVRCSMEEIYPSA